MGQKIGFGAGGSRIGRDQLASDDVATEDEAAGAVADVFELAAFDLARCKGKPGSLRSKAWTPVSSSVLRVCSPWVVRLSAC
jgi:hypothetical protein